MRSALNNGRYSDLVRVATTPTSASSIPTANATIETAQIGSRSNHKTMSSTESYTAIKSNQRQIRDEAISEQMMWRARAHSTGTRSSGPRALRAAASNAALLLAGTTGIGYSGGYKNSNDTCFGPRRTRSNLSDLDQIRTGSYEFDSGAGLFLSTELSPSANQRRLIDQERPQQHRQQSEESNATENSRHSVPSVSSSHQGQSSHQTGIQGKHPLIDATNRPTQKDYQGDAIRSPTRSPKLVLNGAEGSSNMERDGSGAKVVDKDRGGPSLEQSIENNKINARCAAGDTGPTRSDNYVEQHALELLRKSSFTCMVIGARQTGKRTIVKCFVKLLNEFKLAAAEYKKEKMLTKLVGFSERLQEIQQQRQESIDEQERQSGQRSRLNSWLGGTTVNRLLNLTVPANKQRLHSVSGLSPNHNLSSESQQQPRRHTAIEAGRYRASFQAQPPGSLEDQSMVHDKKTDVNPKRVLKDDDSKRFLNVERANRLTSCSNKSDTHVNYAATTTTISASQNNLDTNQLKVPDLNCHPSLRKSSDFSSLRGSVFLNEPDPDTGNAMNGSNLTINQPTGCSGPRLSTASAYARPKHQSILAMGRRRRRAKLSLKEMNRRRCRVLFKTRRIISDKFARILCPEEDSEEADLYAQRSLPDAFIVVYSINDR